MGELRKVCAGVHVLEAPQRFMGAELGTRMTVLELRDGLLIHSPVASDPADLESVGEPRWVLAPNKFHHLYVDPWLDAGLEGWAAPGLTEKREDLDFAGELTADVRPFGDEVQLLPLTCFSMTNEVVVHHVPSRTLVVTDLVFNIPRSAPWFTRASMWCLRGYPGCRTTLLERVGMKRDAARRDLERILEWDFDRVIMAHGEIIETGGKDAVKNAFSWLF